MLSSPSITLPGIQGLSWATEMAQMRADLDKARRTGNVPPGVDAAGIIKVVYSILSTYIAPLEFQRLASKVAGKPSMTPRLDLLISMPSAAGNPSVPARFAGTGAQAATAVQS